MVWGNPEITVDPDKATPYILYLCTWKRGVFTGNMIINKMLTTILGKMHDEKKLKCNLHFSFLINSPEGNLVFRFVHLIDT